jgi:hypothetical protein
MLISGSYEVPACVFSLKESSEEPRMDSEEAIDTPRNLLLRCQSLACRYAEVNITFRHCAPFYAVVRQTVLN